MIAHPRLPLLAGLDAERPAVHLLSPAPGGGAVRRITTVGGESEPYGDAFGWERYRRTPAAAWHPVEPVLVVSGEEYAVRLTPSGTEAAEGVRAGCRDLAFHPDGRTLWVSPSAAADGADVVEGTDRTDVVDVATGRVTRAPWWDTGVAQHPAGGLLLTFRSDQGATLGLFARPASDGGGAMHVLRRALVLDVDGYETPVFSPDGRHFAIRGNAYGNTLEVFAFPSLRREMRAVLGEPSPGYPYPQEWLDGMQAWSRQNLAYTAEGLWVGTPEGTLLQIDVASGEAVTHDLLDGARITALASTASGALAVATARGELATVEIEGAGAPSAPPSREPVDAFLAGTAEVADPWADPWAQEGLVLTDGDRTWESSDLDEVTESSPADPGWLQIQSFMNQARRD
ncbi:hypothetical protein BIV57_19045 [Mangrovactinospora gilvigrisea]|uniref:Lipoprotein LpqB beta-propeller domain-containing protein n=1 Tax=Mangrovactinospora gilvigrisea TaxID=1428644 RepID=A0A1J7BBD4_9ACTN|nr:hypothetical protein BIV57_19045 [Mangrovactinospora gilvigrisea]